jgi:hypothetical protein
MPLTLPYEFAGVGLKTPTSRLDADFAAVADWLNTHGAVTGLIGDRPAPTSVGAIYVASDQHDLWYMADGTAWHPVGRAADSVLDVDPVTGTVRAWGAAVGAGAQSVLAMPLASGPVPPVAGAASLWVGDTQGMAGRAAWRQTTEDGWSQPLDKCLHRAAGAPLVTITNSAVETLCWSQLLAANTLTAGGVGAAAPRGIECAFGFDVTNSAATARALTLRVKFGGQTGYAATLTLPVSMGTRGGAVVVRIEPLAPLGGGYLAFSRVVSQWDLVETLVLGTPQVDGTVPQTLELTAQLSLAVTSLTVRFFSATVSLA